MSSREFLDVDPRTLHLPPSRRDLLGYLPRAFGSLPTVEDKMP